MLRTQLSSTVAYTALACLALSSTALAEHGLKKGTIELKQAGALTFGPAGILFVGDSRSASVYAIDTGEHTLASGDTPVNVPAVNEKIAALIGSDVQNTLINDMAVNPTSGNIYFSVSRGRGPDATPILFRANAKGELSEFNLENVSFAKATFDNAPENGRDRRGRNPRLNAITDLQFNEGKLIVAGLSNEEFASKLRVLDFPFSETHSDTSVQVFHGAHGRLETASPVRTFITYENTVLAAYTCTPLVTIPVEDLNGEKIMGKTVAELGNRNSPLDMIIYKKGDSDYLLLSNTARGVMKMRLSRDAIENVESIRSKITGTAGLEYETLDQFENVVQLDKRGEHHAVMLVQNSSGTLDLQTVALP